MRRAFEFVGLAPDRSEQYLIKRVIGTEGDTVTCCSADGRITVNGQELEVDCIVMATGFVRRTCSCLFAFGL